jgi:hypothetical protein
MIDIARNSMYYNNVGLMRQAWIKYRSKEAQVKKILILGMLAFIATACQRNPLVGQWERYGDDAAGSIVEVEGSGGRFFGKLVKVAGVLERLEFEDSDIKWRDIEPMGVHKWSGQDLIKEIDSTGTIVSVGYKDVYFVLINDAELEVRWFAKEKEFVGTVQHWKKL